MSEWGDVGMTVASRSLRPHVVKILKEFNRLTLRCHSEVHILDKMASRHCFILSDICVKSC